MHKSRLDLSTISNPDSSAHVTRSTLIEMLNNEDPLTKREAIKCGGIFDSVASGKNSRLRLLLYFKRI